MEPHSRLWLILTGNGKHHLTPGLLGGGVGAVFGEVLAEKRLANSPIRLFSQMTHGFSVIIFSRESLSIGY